MTSRYSILIYILLFSIFQTQAQVNNDWPCYGKDPGGSRYSPLTQINEQNVQQLKIAWTFRTGELETYEGTEAKSKAAFEATPVLVDSTLYFSTPDRVFDRCHHRKKSMVI